MARTPQPQAAEFDIGLLAGDFPPGLNTASRATDLAPNETPDSYGLALTVDGALVKGTTIPTLETRIAGDYHYNRMWARSGTSLTYGAPFYDAVMYSQGLSKIPFLEDAESLIDVFVPFGGSQAYVGKTTGGYILGNLTDKRGQDFWSKTDIIQALKCTAAANVTALDGMVFVCNATGLQAYSNGRVIDATRKVRDALTNFASQALTVDYEKKYIRGGNNFIYEVTTGKLFRWNSTNFRYTSPRHRKPDWSPFAVDRLLFECERSDTNESWLEYEVRLDDDQWRAAPRRVVMDFGEGEYVTKSTTTEDILSTVTFQLRITDMSDNLRIKEIRIDAEEQEKDDFVQ